MTNLPALLGRLRAATGPDRTLDADICVSLGYVPGSPNAIDVRRGADDPDWGVDEDDLLFEVVEDGKRVPCVGVVPPFTGSVDLVVELVERMLPGAPLTLITLGNPDNPSIAVLHIDNGATTPPTEIAGEGPTAGLAILIATIEALMTREGSDD